MDHISFNPSVQLRCHRCQRITPHIMIDFSNNPASALTMVYECQECGETKKALDLNTLPELKVLTTSSNPSPFTLSPKKIDEPIIPIEREAPINR
jgi:uncharacterized Zn finger protein